MNNKITEPTSLESIKLFMCVCNQPIYRTPTIPTEARIKLRLSLSLEELSELAESAAALQDYKVLLEKKLKDVEEKIQSKKFEVPNLAGVLDALVDMRYVNDGAVHEFGLGSIFNDAFTLIHDSNMSKFCTTEEEAKQSIVKYKEEGLEVHTEEHKGLWLIYRSSDKKVLKSINWKEADLTKLI